MIIGVDAGCIGVSDDRLKVGVYNFALNLLENLSKYDRENKYLLYSFDKIPADILKKLGSNFIHIVLRPRKGWFHLRLSLEFLLHKPDLFLGLSQALPFYHPMKSIIYVHDLAFELYPQFYPDSYKRLRRQTKFAVQHCNKVIAVSNATKNDLVKLYKINPDKIEVIYHGVNSLTVQPATPEVDKPYFLYVGSYKPIKNIPNIIKAFKFFLQEIKKPYQLILAGSDYWMDENIQTTIMELKLEKLVKLVEFVKGENLPRLYSGAVAFISPSFYEGFGMPLLEAMASATPVITSDRGSIPEVVKDSALLVDPDNIDELKKAMLTITTNEKLRMQMIKKGLRQAQKFSWEKSAGELFKLINTI